MSDDRRIYSPPNGDPAAYRYDPIFTLRELILGSGGKVNEWLADHRQKDDPLKAAEAEEKIVRLVRAVFKLDAWTKDIEHGWTDAEVLGLLNHFNRWLAGKGGRG